MTTRQYFEAWIKAPPYERRPLRFPETSATWPGNYRELDIDLAWCAYQAGADSQQAQIERLRSEREIQESAMANLRAGLRECSTARDSEIERMRRALHEIAEEWAGAECGEPVHAQEAYAIGLAKRMYALAAAAREGSALAATKETDA